MSWAFGVTDRYGQRGILLSERKYQLESTYEI